jgi:hypothetical protein
VHLCLYFPVLRVVMEGGSVRRAPAAMEKQGGRCRWQVVCLVFIRCKSRSEVGCDVTCFVDNLSPRQSGATLLTASTAPKAAATVGLLAPPSTMFLLLLVELHVRGKFRCGGGSGHPSMLSRPWRYFLRAPINDRQLVSAASEGAWCNSMMATLLLL